MNLLIMKIKCTKEQAEDYEKNFDPNHKDHIMVNRDNPTPYVAGLLTHIYNDAIIEYENSDKTFIIKYKAEDGEYEKVIFKEKILTEVFNTFTSQLVKLCNYNGNKWTTELIQHISF